MIKIQVAYGRHAEADVRCGRCGGDGRDPVATQAACVYCGGSGQVLEVLGRAYTYLAPEGVRLFDLVYVDAPGGGSQIATVVSLTSDYRGPMKQAWPVPQDTRACPACDGAEIPLRWACCASCWERVPSELKHHGIGPFAAAGMVIRVRAWLKANPA